MFQSGLYFGKNEEVAKTDASVASVRKSKQNDFVFRRKTAQQRMGVPPGNHLSNSNRVSSTKFGSIDSAS